MSQENLSKIKNISPRAAANIAAAGIFSLEEMRKLGTKEVFLRIFEAVGVDPVTSCHSFLCGVEGAICGGLTRNELPDRVREDLMQFLQEFRKSLQP